MAQRSGAVPHSAWCSAATCALFGKLGLVGDPGVHRRVLAVLTYVRA